MSAVVRGQLLVKVEEASGKTNNEQFVWDTASSTAFEAFIKGARCDGTPVPRNGLD